MATVVESEVIQVAPEANLADVGAEAQAIPVAPRKKWYLKTEEIYAVVKHAAADIHVGDVALAERAIEVVDNFALAISKDVLRIKEAEGLSIVKKMDEFTTSLCAAIDNGVDVYSVKFAESVEKLGNVVMTNTEWVSESVKVKATKAQEHMQAVSEKMSQGVNTAYSASEPYVNRAIEVSEPYVKTGIDTTKGVVTAAVGTVDDYLKAWLNKMSEDYPEAAARIRQYILTPNSTSALMALTTAERRGEILHNVQTAVHTAVHDKVNSYYGAVQTVLGTWQPYVVKAVDAATPYVNKAVVVATPYVAKAVDAAEPIMSSPYVASHTKQILENKVVQNTIAKTQTAVSAVKAYCTKKDNEDAAKAIAAVTTGCTPATEAAPSSSSSYAAVAATPAEPTAAGTVCPLGAGSDMPPAASAADSVTSVGKDDENDEVAAEDGAAGAGLETGSVVVDANVSASASAVAAGTSVAATDRDHKTKGGKHHKKGGGAGHPPNKDGHGGAHAE